MNATMNTILSRYSCRAYTDEALTSQELQTLVDAALAAPTGMNRQGYRVVVIKDKALLKRMDDLCMGDLKALPDQSAYDRFMQRGGTLFYNAPVMIMLPIEQGTQTDVGIVAQNICLAAQSMGLGSCHCGMARMVFENGRQAEYERLLQFPQGYVFGLAVLVGHSAMNAAPHPLDREKVIYIG